MIYRLPESTQWSEEGFTNPFRYTPHPLVQKAAAEVMSRLQAWKDSPDGSHERELERSFAEGKMLGVLVCNHPSDRELCYLAAFSGTVQGQDGRTTSSVIGFVPPILDLTDPKGYFKIEEEKISKINKEIVSMGASEKLSALKDAYHHLSIQRDSELNRLQSEMQFSKRRREEIRCETTDPNILNDLIKESQFQKAEFKRQKDKWKVQLDSLSQEISKIENTIASLKSKRAEMSDELQRWIFNNTFVHNALGQTSNIWDLFQDGGLIPPGGAGDCAGPKLLEYAYRNGLHPLAMGEFWYGNSPDTAVRTHGHFYPSCTSKCGPLLGYMMKGLEVMPDAKSISLSPVIVYEDDSIIVVEKPSGMPSVPGLDGRLSLQEWLVTRQYESSTPSTEFSVTAVHRLDMDTSGIMVFAKTRDAEIDLKKQFEEHSVRKTYLARLTSNQFKSADKGIRCIDLPLSADYDERPRQKVDFKQGKEAHTEYEFVKEYADGTADLLLYPHTGRTHQLRVHCAHTLGLARPILGDLLYGAHTIDICKGYCPESGYTHPSRLCLHALSITFRHPDTDATLTFTSSHLAY